VNAAAAQALLDAELERARHEIPASGSLDALDELERTLTGKRSRLAEVHEAIKSLDTGERPIVGKAVTAFKEEIRDLLGRQRAAISAIATEGRWERERADLTLPGRGPSPGHLHLITQVQQELEDVFIGLGFEVAEGPEAETDWYNFEALNMPPDHPARSMWDTLYLKLGDAQQVLLRTHTSPVQIRVMESRRPPIYVVMPGRCYRRDTLDARHSPVFHQIEGLVVDRGITFGHLAGTVEAFTQAYLGAGHHARLRPSYFPFTEPSAELEVTCVFCEGRGCSVCSGTGWVELGGCGMVDPNVFVAVGYDPEEFTGFAFGFGLERMAQIRFGIDHIKTYFENDVRFLRQY
jgi:phenylalanyl-tRNA synthetase alpha chain